MIQLSYSWWGLKNTGEDITTAMLNIIRNANSFIVVGGYNFTFRSSAGARPFFDELTRKRQAGVQVLMMFPPKLHGKYNPQRAIINYCFNNGITVILNHQNHSKWLLTETQMYYGSSNYTNASWRNNVEVVSLHDHTNISKQWSKDTITDFYKFLRKEITDLNATKRRMKNYRGLLTATRTAWANIKSLIHKLNPSIEKVIKTVSNYDEIQSILKEQIIYWFDHYDKNHFDTILSLSTEITIAIDNLCEYAYGQIYNESVDSEYVDVLSRSTIDNYNQLYYKAVEVIDTSIKGLPEIDSEQEIHSDLSLGNIKRINEIHELITHYLNPEGNSNYNNGSGS